MSVIEDIPLAVYLDNTAVIVCTAACRHIRRLVGIYMQVSVADQYAAVSEAAQRFIADSIAELVHDLGRVYEIILSVHLAYGRSLEKCVSLELGACTVTGARNYDLRLGDDSQHILIQCDRLCACSGLVALRTKSAVQIGLAALGDNSGIELWLVTLSFSEKGAVGIADIAVELVLSRRLVTYRNRHNAHLVKDIIEVVSSVGTDCYIRCIKAHMTVLVERIGVSGIDNSLIAPVAKVVNRC